MDLTEIRKRAMYDPQSLTPEEWGIIHKAATTVPKKDFSDDDDSATASPLHRQKKKGEVW